MKIVLTIILLALTLSAQAAEQLSCRGSVLERRFALIQFGRLADAFVAANGQLPDICETPVEGVSDRVPEILAGSRVCGSSKEGAVHYSCELDPPDASSEVIQVIESCRYSLVDQSVSCTNRAVTATFEN